jgi:cytochrome c biogenesis protein CcmG/thiol:disulfide interchange protein DsbE
MNRTVLGTGLLAVVVIVALLASGLGRDPHRMTSPLVGRAAPPFKLPSLEDGREVTLDSLRDRPVVLNFWASWCAECRGEHELLNRAAGMLEPSVRFVGVVHRDRPESALAFLEAHGAAYPFVLDPGDRTAIAYGIYGIPETFFIDRNGTVVAKHIGPLDARSLAVYLRKAAGSS